MVGRELACRRLVLTCIGLHLCGVGFAALSPLLLKRLIDGAMPSEAVPTKLAGEVAAFVIVWTAGSLVSSLAMVCSTQVNGKLAENLTVKAIGGYLGQFQPGGQSSGTLLGNLERLAYSLMVVVDGFIWRALPLILQFAVSLAVILRLLSWRYLVVMAGLAAGFVTVSWYGARRHAETATQVTKAYGANSGFVGDVLRNAERVVCNGAIAHEIEAIRTTLSARTRAATHSNWSLARLSGMQYGVIALGLFVLLLMAGIDRAHGVISVGDFVLVQTYGFNLILPMAAIGFVISQTATAIANISDVLAMECDQPVEAYRINGERPQHPARVEVQGVSFGYGVGVPAVRQVSVEFPPASFSVIVGRNGSGKSTLARLIAGRLSPHAGSIRFDGIALSSMGANHRYGRVLYVPQRTRLMNRSLRDNLTYPPSSKDPTAAETRLKRWDFFEANRAIDLDLIVGEDTARLSGGQAQKLELARVADIEVSCLVLDEATSAMDPASEDAALRDLLQLRGGKSTLIMVTHKAPIAAMADQVLWMVDGHLAGIGGHDELSRFAEYRALWNGKERESEGLA